MRILISNDDGVHAAGLHALAKEFSDHDVVVVAPERERSTTGHSLTLHKPLRLYKHAANVFAVSGGPADCIYVGIKEVMGGKRPDFILSGINRGANLGQDVFYSGTASAAREGANMGIPSMAISLSLDHHKTGQAKHYAAAAKMAKMTLKAAFNAFHISKPEAELRKFWPQGLMLNLNVPNLPKQKIKGLKVATQGYRVYGGKIVKRKDARGRDYFWIGGKYKGFKNIPESDCWYVDKGFAAVTPLELDTTYKAVYDRLLECF